jgi:hypothetical protein
MRVNLSPDEYFRSAIELDVNLPELVPHFINLVRKRWTGNPNAKNIGEIPNMLYDVQGSHGPDEVGLVYTAKMEEPMPKPYSHENKWEVTARCSIGQEGNNHKFVWTPPSHSRLHLSVNAQRYFCPKDYFEWRVSSETCLFPVEEEIHLSLRWVDGKLQNHWNDREDPFKGRTSFLRYRRSSGGGFGVGLNKEQVKEYVASTLGYGEGVLEKHFAHNPRNSTEEFHDIGYKPVLDYLAKLSSNPKLPLILNEQSTPRVTQEQAVDFLINEALSALEQFAQSGQPQTTKVI